MCFAPAAAPSSVPPPQPRGSRAAKIFAKNFLQQSGIPTAAFVAAPNAAEARRALDRFSYPVVIKADGLAAGKGVVVAEDRAAAEAALESLKPPFVIEEFLAGEEVSYIVLSDGRNVVPLEPTQDHKAVFDGDTGPNTGGMGAYCDSRILTAAESRAILDRIIRPTIEATGFTGFLYAGLMMTAAGPKVLEFNVRLGDPETQPIMHRMRTISRRCCWPPRAARCPTRAWNGTWTVGLRGAGIRRLSRRIHRRQADPRNRSRRSHGRHSIPRGHAPRVRGDSKPRAAASSASPLPVRTWPPPLTMPTPRRA
jgi:hypothetical protein